MNNFLLCVLRVLFVCGPTWTKENELRFTRRSLLWAVTVFAVLLHKQVQDGYDTSGISCSVPPPPKLQDR